MTIFVDRQNMGVYWRKLETNLKTKCQTPTCLTWIVKSISKRKRSAKNLLLCTNKKFATLLIKKREKNKSNKVKENTDATVLKTKNDDRPKQDSSPRNRRNNGWKSKGAVNRKEDKRIKISTNTAQRVADSKNTDNAVLHHTLETQSSEQKGDSSIPDDRATPSKTRQPRVQRKPTQRP
ncbi:hypothetical protein DPMN_067939 [Dreissena polymorpha]|uniref:Uncharacterized protein n=1 Tax=Dreissena polymorpha TaxID=45954 RepID=A0A9D3YY86_DREPO|nr:hypothetical protein DPMN_067939 [Dreissena polymorpha]